MCVFTETCRSRRSVRLGRPVPLHHGYDSQRVLPFGTPNVAEETEATTEYSDYTASWVILLPRWASTALMKALSELQAATSFAVLVPSRALSAESSFAARLFSIVLDTPSRQLSVGRYRGAA